MSSTWITLGCSMRAVARASAKKRATASAERATLGSIHLIATARPVTSLVAA